MRCCDSGKKHAPPSGFSVLSTHPREATPRKAGGWVDGGRRNTLVFMILFDVLQRILCERETRNTSTATHNPRSPPPTCTLDVVNKGKHHCAWVRTQSPFSPRGMLVPGLLANALTIRLLLLPEGVVANGPSSMRIIAPLWLDTIVKHDLRRSRSWLSIVNFGSALEASSPAPATLDQLGPRSHGEDQQQCGGKFFEL